MRAVTVYAVSRVVVAAVAAVCAATADGGEDVAAGPWPGVERGGPGWAAPLYRWDSAWYAHVAEDWYPGPDDVDERLQSIAFFPLFPLLLRSGAHLTGLAPVVVGVVLATALGAVAVALLRTLVARLADGAAADRTVCLVSFFPGAFVLSIAYAEALMLVLAVACLLALADERWRPAGLAAALATATRPTGVALVAACAVAAAVAVARRREWRALWAPALAPLGLVAFTAHLAARTGEPLVWLRAQDEGWHDRTDLGRRTAERVIATVRDPAVSLDRRGLNALVLTLGVAFAVAGVVLLLRWRPGAATVTYALVVLALAVVSQNIGPRPRFLLGAFPLVAAVAVAVRGRAFAAVVAASAVGLVALSAVTFSTLAATP